MYAPKQRQTQVLTVSSKLQTQNIHLCDWSQQKTATESGQVEDEELPQVQPVTNQSRMVCYVQ